MTMSIIFFCRSLPQYVVAVATLLTSEYEARATKWRKEAMRSVSEMCVGGLQNC